MGPRIASPLLIFASFLVFGALNGATATSEAAGYVLRVIHWVLVAFLLYWWVSADALQRQVQLSTSMIVCLVVFGFLALPFYLAGTRSEGSWVRWLPKGVVLAALCFSGHYFTFGAVESSAHAS